MELQGDAVSWAADVWLEVRADGTCREVERKGLVVTTPQLDPGPEADNMGCADSGSTSLVRSIWRAHGMHPGWTPIVSQRPAMARASA